MCLRQRHIRNYEPQGPCVAVQNMKLYSPSQSPNVFFRAEEANSSEDARVPAPDHLHSWQSA